MDRTIEYPGAIPLETDLLSTQRNVMIALGWALQGYLGAETFLDGFTCVQTTVASQQVQVNPGQILTVANVDGSAYSSLAADTTHQIIKQGLLLNPTLFTCAAPLTVGQSVNYLIEIAQQDVDGTPVVIPYYNPSNPNVAWSGPNGAGTTNNTVRQSQAVVQIKTGVAATSGTQVTPSPDAGFTGAFVITVAYGQTTITNANISTLATAPFVPVKLPGVPAAVQSNKWASALDTSVTANALNVPLIPVPSTIPFGMSVTTKVLTTNTGPSTMNVGTGAVAVIYPNGSPMLGGELSAGRTVDFLFNGTSWELQGNGYAPILQGNRNYYVDGTHGSDSNNGLAAGTGNAFATIQKAVNTAYSINANGFAVTINVADGTYAPLAVTGVFNGTLSIIGDTATPTNCVISSTSATQACVSGNNSAVFTIQGFTLTNTLGNGLVSQNNAIVSFSLIAFSSCVNGNHIFIDTGRVSCIGNYSIISNALNHVLLTYGEFILTPSTPNTVTISTCALSTAFVNAQNISFIRANTNTNFSGAPTSGTKYSATQNSVIQTSGAGVNFFPSPTAGGTASGGVYQ